MTRVVRHCVLLLLCLPFHLPGQGIFPQDTLELTTSQCNGSVPVCISLPSGNLQQYTLLQDGQVWMGGLKGCDFDTMVTYTYNTLLGLGNMGPYRLDSWVVSGTKYQGIFQDIGELVSMMNQWDPQGNWQHKAANLTISGGAPGKTYSNMEVTVLLNNTPSIIGVNFGLLPRGTELPFSQGAHTLVAIDNSSQKRDTMVVVVHCLAPSPPNFITDTIQANGYPYSTCIKMAALSGPPVQFYNACPDDSGMFVHFYLDTVNHCVKYQGLMCGGTEQACIVACDANGTCDTTYISVKVDFSLCSRSAHKVSDTIVVNFTQMHCLDTLRLPGNIVLVENLCPDDSGTYVAFEYDESTHCVTYTGLAPGTERGCFLLTDSFGNQDTAYVCVTVRLPESGIILDTLLLGQVATYCPDNSELAGNPVSIVNICPATPVGQVSFSVNTLALCLEAKAEAIGTDTACITVCDDYGVCDTTFYIITVIPDDVNPCPFALPPGANNDLAHTLKNTPVNIEILKNDDLGGCPFASVEVLDDASSGPFNGLTVLNPNMSVDYYPAKDFCGMDTFRYRLCSPLGCDTAMVLVQVGCVAADTIVIYNAISPNGDGHNDFFKIENIEHYPDNEVKVFNRWGNLVFQARNYDNTWDGRYEGKKLPDGTYFYRILLGDGRQFTGFLQIHR